MMKNIDFFCKKNPFFMVRFDYIIFPLGEIICSHDFVLLVKILEGHS